MDKLATVQIEHFLEQLSVINSASQHTIQAYQRDLRALQSLAESLGLQEWDQLEPAHIRQYSSQRNRQHVSARTIQQKPFVRPRSVVDYPGFWMLINWACCSIIRLLAS